MPLAAIVVFLVISVDQFCKHYVRLHLQQPQEFLGGLFELQYSQNTGMAFSILADRPVLMTVLTTLITVVLIVYALTLYKEETNSWIRLSFSLLIGGALSNLWDRYTLGFVVDYINPLFVDFAIFNLADAALNIGAGVLVLSYLRK